ncbi:hypothetical protein [Calycomorphotria hydatis]|uniref:Uncharacterized protein n=1 Tax=Calycomorphotria hydatis TaxID=2528027 RepID=A0A517TB67_9PLAN|nr:hypothetical protein [Calycomorphotria hydatis]QDT65621.1 hypothetical protein V22_28790 [Calycomorphotria hydatis]
MPQQLQVFVGNNQIAQMTTGNLGGTKYKILLSITGLGQIMELDSVDTGVQRQPQEPFARRKDGQNDFAHARRCIAAAVAAHLDIITAVSKHSETSIEAKQIELKLKTNEIDRGTITVEPTSDTQQNVKVSIGLGNNRFPGAQPSIVSIKEWYDVSIPCPTTHTERAFATVAAIGEELLDWLSDEAQKVP